MKRRTLWLMILLVALCLLAACGGQEQIETPEPETPVVTPVESPDNVDDPDKVILNPADDDDENAFVDIDELDALCAAYDNLQYTQVQDRGEGEIESEIYIKGQKIKIVRSLSDDDNTAYEYYDLDEQTIITYSSDDSEAFSSSIEVDSESLPELATKFGYGSNFSIGETVQFDGVTCKILESADGAKMLWVDAQTALPVQYELRDMRGGTLYYACQFRDYAFDTVNDGDVTVPSTIKVISY